ncbi:MAG: hypothetical protein WD555_05410 [Fulvivirga sp.]
MLKDSLYTLKEIETKGENLYSVEAIIDSQHEIFSGHFPQQPVLPGVCLLDMLKEMIREITTMPYRMIAADNIKYLKPLDPRQHAVIRFEILLKPAEEGLSATAISWLPDGVVNFKFKGKFSLV